MKKKDTLEIALETKWEPCEIKNLVLKEGDDFRKHLIKKIKTAKVITFTAKRRNY